MVKFLDLFEIDLPEVLDNQYGEFIILLLIWVLIGLVVALLLRPLVHSLFAKTKTDVDDKVLAIVEGPVVLLIFLFGAVESLRVLDAVPTWLREGIMSMYTLIVSLVVVYLAYRVFRAVFIPLGTEFSRKRKSRLERTILPVVDQIGASLIVIFGLFWILSNMGVNVTVFLAGIGVAGLVLAFALQDTLSNYFSGLHLMLDQPFKVRDVIQFHDKYCEVLKVGFRSTRLYSIYDHEILIAPNNMLANELIVNKTEPDIGLRIAVEVGVAYGSPIEKVKEILLEAVMSQDGIIKDNPDREITVRFRDFAESSLNFRVMFFVDDWDRQWSIAAAVREHIDRRFHEEGITIPFPQRTLSFLERTDEARLRAGAVPVPAGGEAHATPS